MGYLVPGAPAGSTSLSPAQQKQFSSWWLNEKYGGDFNNVEGLTQNSVTGNWQADPLKTFDINPETGQKGLYKYMATPAFVGWMDITPDKTGTYTNVGNGGQVEMVRNRHGIYSPVESYYSSGNGLIERYEFTENPNTGEKGRWTYIPSMGLWSNKDNEVKTEPADGSPAFGANNQVVGSYLSSRDNPDGTAFTGGNSSNKTASTPPPETPPAVTPPATPPAVTPPAVVPRTGMLNPDQSSWLQVLNRQGANLESWDPYLGMFTNRESNVDWTQLDSNQVQSSFDSLAGEGLFPSLQQQSIYADLLKRLGYA